MILLTILILTLLILIAFIVGSFASIGAVTIIIFGDVIVCLVFLIYVIKKLIQKKSKK